MSKVLTYKCDVCGEVYHVNEKNNESVEIVVSTVTETEGSNSIYEHICPGCRNNINKIMANPKLIDELHTRISCAVADKHKIQKGLDKIIWEFRSKDPSLVLDIPLYIISDSGYEDAVSKCIDSLVSLDMSRKIWKFASCLLMIISISLVFGLLAATGVIH